MFCKKRDKFLYIQGNSLISLVHPKKKKTNKKTIKEYFNKIFEKKHLRGVHSWFLVKLQAFWVKQKLNTTQISFKDFVQVCVRPFLQNIFSEMFRAKTLLTLISKVKNLCQWSAQIGFVRVSLLTNSFTTFCRFRLSVRSLWNFRSIRELNLASKIVDRSQVFRFLANQKGSFSCCTCCSIKSCKLNYNDNFGNQNKIFSREILHMLSYIFRTYKMFILAYKF